VGACKVAGIAQLVERLLAMQKVAGSSPVARLLEGSGIKDQGSLIRARKRSLIPDP
jgi:hypothetical protein